MQKVPIFFGRFAAESVRSATQGNVSFSFACPKRLCHGLDQLHPEPLQRQGPAPGSQALSVLL